MYSICILNVIVTIVYRIFHCSKNNANFLVSHSYPALLCSLPEYVEEIIALRSITLFREIFFKAFYVSEQLKSFLSIPYYVF